MMGAALGAAALLLLMLAMAGGRAVVTVPNLGSLVDILRGPPSLSVNSLAKQPAHHLILFSELDRRSLQVRGAAGRGPPLAATAAPRHLVRLAGCLNVRAGLHAVLATHAQISTTCRDTTTRKRKWGGDKP